MYVSNDAAIMECPVAHGRCELCVWDQSEDYCLFHSFETQQGT